MSDYRAKAQDLCMADAMPFNQHFEYRTTLPLVEVIHDRFFLPVAGNLRAGDLINLVSFDRPVGPQHNGRVVEIATVRVVEKRADAVELFQVGEMAKVPRTNGKADHTAEALATPRERYIPGDGKAVWNLGKRAYDVKVGNKIVATEPDGDKARAMARGDIPLPEHA